MKTLKKGEKIIRVKDNEVDKYLKTGYEYCAKNLWKESKRNKRKNNPDLQLRDEKTNLSDKKKRKIRKENKRKKYESNN